MSKELDFNKVQHIVDDYKNYHEHFEKFMPGFRAFHDLGTEFLDRYLRMNDASNSHEERIMIVGGGGGMEVRSLSARKDRKWRLTVVDPSSRMLDIAKAWSKELDLKENQTEFVEGFVDSVPSDQLFDAATLYLVLHFLETEEEKLKLLKEISSKLKPGAPFIVVHVVGDKNGPEFFEDSQIQMTYAARKGVPEEKILGLRAAKDKTFLLLHGRDEALLEQAGFAIKKLYFSCLSVRAWVCQKI